MLLNATAWQSDYPELGLPSLLDRPNTAIAFSGGGVRAYTAAFGQLAALHKLGLLRKVRYITGISGGSWATATYSYAQLGARGVAENDEVLLGPVLEPAELNASTLAAMDEHCARRAATRFVAPLRAEEDSTASSLANAVLPALLHEWFLRPVGVPRRALFTLDVATRAAIHERNPALGVKERFLTLPPSGERPYPILGTSLLGPARLAPLSFRRRANETLLLEVTPLYAGSLPAKELRYSSRGGRGNVSVSTVGGLLEPLAFGGGAPAAGLPRGVASAILRDVPVERTFGLEDAMAASSWFPGMGLSVLGLNQLLGLQYPYFAPAAPSPRAEDFLFGDGGDFENIHLIGLLKRRVRSIVLFFNSEQPLVGAGRWDPATQEPTSALIADCLPPFFGVRSWPTSVEEVIDMHLGVSYSSNQVFPTAAFAPLVQQLQAAQAAGGGVVVRAPLVTVTNDVWDVPAGFEVNVTFVYLSRMGAWEKQLSSELKAMVQPNVSAPDADYSITIDSGPYKDFPHYSTNLLQYSVEKANLLAHATGWGVLNNADVFRRALM